MQPGKRDPRMKIVGREGGPETTLTVVEGG